MESMRKAVISAHRMPDELREDNLFEDLTHARVMLDW